MRLGSETPKRSTSPHISNGSSNGLSPAFAKIANGHSNGKAESNGSPAVRNGNGPVAARSFPAKWYGHDREEVARILIQSLTDLGYQNSARALSRESGFELEGPTVAAFRSAVLQGEWAEAEALLFGTSSYESGGGVGISDGGGKGIDDTLRDSWAYQGYTGGLTLAEGANKNEMLFWLRQQKYLELLEKRDSGAALMVLRQELTPLNRDVSRLHHLSSLMMCKPEELKAQAHWDGAAGVSRSQLLSELSKSISPSVMIPENRLAILLGEVKDGWIQNCLYHNTPESPSLYTDHVCEPDNFPMYSSLSLSHHQDEVWYLSFSNDGTRLATAGLDKSVFIYDTTKSFQLTHQLEDHDAGVCYVAWSPDDTKIITCTREPDCMARLWDARDGSLLTTITDFQHPVTAAAWAPDGHTFIIGSQDQHQALALWDINEEIVYKWREEKMRVYDLSLSPDGTRLVVLLVSSIVVYDFATREKIAEWAFEDVKMTSVNISADSKLMLVSMNENKIRLMVIDTGEVLQSFEGNKQSEFMIRSAFGGANENFVVSGSEDSRVYIWRTTGHLVESLDAHRPGCVNAVAWHPKDPSIFATAGDDHRVKIWSTHDLTNNQSIQGSNGYSSATRSSSLSLIPSVGQPTSPRLPVLPHLPDQPALPPVQSSRIGRPRSTASLASMDHRVIELMTARQTNPGHTPPRFIHRFERIPQIPEIIVALPRRVAPPPVIRATNVAQLTYRARSGRVFSVVTGREITEGQTPTEYLQALLAPSDVWD